MTEHICTCPNCGHNHVKNEHKNVIIIGVAENNLPNMMSSKDVLETFELKPIDIKPIEIKVLQNPISAQSSKKKRKSRTPRRKNNDYF